MSPSPRFVVGFDLDMTLFDTRPSIGATLRAVAEDLGVEFDVARFLRELGPPLDVMVGEQLPADLTETFVDRYREIYHVHGLPAASLLPGAREAIEEVKRRGGESIVITGKNDRDANRHIAHARLDVAHVIGWAWAQGKTDALRAHSASAYVGDHPADVAAAKAAASVAIAVTTGSHTADSFAQADVVLDSLLGFPQWLDKHLAG